MMKLSRLLSYISKVESYHKRFVFLFFVLELWSIIKQVCVAVRKIEQKSMDNKPKVNSHKTSHISTLIHLK